MKVSRIFLVFSVLMLTTFALATSALGQLLNENFNYPAGDSLNVLHEWIVQPTASYVNTIKVASPGLTYTGYPSSGIGNSALVDTTGQDIYHSFAGQTSGSVYAAFLVSATKVTATGDYFFHFSEAGTTTFRGRVYARLSGADIQFGLLKGSVGTPAYTTATYPIGTTHLIVMKYAFNATSTTDDSVFLWINPVVGGPEATPALSYGSTDADFSTLSAVNLRQGTAANAPRSSVDGIRVGTSWAVVVNGVVPPLSGTKTIGGTSPDYPTIKAALRDLTALGTTAPGVTFLVRSGTYTEDSLIVRTSTASATAPIVIKPDVGATVVVNVTPAGTTLPCVIKIDSTQYVTIDGSNNGTTTRDLTLNSLGTNGLKSVLVFGNSNYATVKNCITRVSSIASSSRNISWEYAGATLNPNNGIIENNLVISGYFGIRCEGNATSDAINNIIIRNNTVDSSGVYGIYVYYTYYAQVYGNDIVHTGASNSTVYCLYVGSVTWYGRFYSNRIHDPISTSASASVIGIAENGTATLAQHTFYNNFIWGLTAPAAGTNSIYGIYCTSTNTSIPDTFAFNSVNLSGTGTGNKNSFGFYKSSASGPAYVVNNIFHNTRNDGTGISGAIGKTTAPTVLVSNNNNLFVTIASDTTHVVGAIGTVRYKGIGEWRTANSSDGSSFSENTSFVSPTDLHIQTTVPTQLESAGRPIVGISTDIDGGTRNATTPDIGADEFAGITVDLTSPLIAYTALNHTALTTARTLTATITDVSGVPTTGVGLPRIYWRRNGGTYTGVTSTFVSGNQYSFTFGGGVATGDTIWYFIVAQDSASTPNVGAQPSGGASGFTANPPTASTPPTTPSRYFIVQQPLIAGDYTIGLTLFEKAIGKDLVSKTFSRTVLREVPVGPEIDHKAAKTNQFSSLVTPYETTEIREVEETYSVLMENDHPYEGEMRVWLTDSQKQELGLSSEVLAVYPTITAAVNDFNLRGVRGSVRFLLNDVSYPTETFPIVISTTSDSVPTAAKTVTFKPNTGVTATVAGAAASGQIFKVLNSYVIFDGSNTVGGSSRNLTIQNTSATSPQVVVFGSTGTTPIVGDTLKNCVVINGVVTSTAVIVSDGTAPGTAGYFSNIGIVNNKIHKAYMGVYSIAAVAASNGTGLTIRGNDLTPTATDSIRYIGIYMQGVDGGSISSNNIGGFSVVTGEIDRGVWLATGTTNTIVEKNTIHDLVYTGTSGYAAKGIAVSTGLAAANNTIQNNMIYNIGGDGDNYTTLGAVYCPTAIYVFGTGQGGVNVHYNSIYLSGNILNYHASVYAFGIALDDGSAASVKNNLVVNNLGLLATTGVGPVGIAAEISNAQFTAIDYNNYYSNATAPAVNNIGKIAGIDYPTLTAWVTASGGETHSISVNANFLSPTNLHIDSTLATPLNGGAIPIAGVSTDFDGQVRNASTPDIGADEFSPFAAPAITEQRRDHVTSVFRATVTNEGTIGSLNAFVGTGPGSGFQFNPATSAGQRLFGDGIVIALDSTHVSDGIRTNGSTGAYDADFKFLTAIDSATTGIRTTMTTSFTDSLAENPIRARINQRTASWDSAGLNNFLIFELDVVNASATPWTTLHVGGLFDWDADPATANDRGAVVVDSTNTIPGVNSGNPFAFDMLEMHQGATPNSWMGVVPLNENRFRGRRIAISSDEIYPTAHVTEGDKWRYITSNRATNPNGDAGSAVDHAQVFGVGPYSVAVGATKRVGFAMFGGTSLANAVSAARAAQRAWVQRLGNTMNVVTTGVNDQTAGTPKAFELAQNFPNPFNPTTTIRFALPEQATVSLKVFNLLGQEIATLAQGEMSAAFHAVVWNGTNQSGSLVASGMYFYRIEATGTSGEKFNSLKKLILLK